MPFAPDHPPAANASKDNSDIDLVEKLLIARRDYQRSLELLRANYIKHGDSEKAKWAEDELREYHRINHQAYRLDLDVPPPTLQATTNIPEANKLIARAKEYKDKGMGDGLHRQPAPGRVTVATAADAVSHEQQNRRSRLLCWAISTKARRSSSIAGRPVYYERCFQWNPSAPLDARMRAARLYDKKLTDRSRASRTVQGDHHARNRPQDDQGSTGSPEGAFGRTLRIDE